MDSRSENRAIGMLAPAKLENPMNHIRCGRTGRRASMQPRTFSDRFSTQHMSERLTGPVIDDPQEQITKESSQLVVQLQTGRIFF